MTLEGTITRTDDDTYTGWIASLTFDVDIVISENPYKKTEKHPDFERVSVLLCMTDLAHASKLKEHDDNDDFQGTTGRAA